MLHLPRRVARPPPWEGAGGPNHQPPGNPTGASLAKSWLHHLPGVGVVVAGLLLSRRTPSLHPSSTSWGGNAKRRRCRPSRIFTPVSHTWARSVLFLPLPLNLPTVIIVAHIFLFSLFFFFYVGCIFACRPFPTSPAAWTSCCPSRSGRRSLSRS
jgi:hypothetical protein